MALTVGIIGLPQSGKTSLFNALTQAGAQVSGYPTSTVQANVAVVQVPDERLEVLAEIFQQHLVRPQIALKTKRVSDLPKRAAKDHSVEPTQHTADRVLICCDKLVHAFLSGSKCFWTTHNDTALRNAFTLVAAWPR